jgi:hypothetical protein
VLRAQLCKIAVNVRGIADVTRAARGTGMFSNEFRDRRGIDVGHVHVGTVPQEALRNDSADAGGTTGDEYDWIAHGASVASCRGGLQSSAARVV